MTWRSFFCAGQQATVAGLEAQIGILQNMLKQFKPALQSFHSAVAKMKSGTLRNSPLVGLVVNQMGVTSIELGDVPQAARFFEEAKALMESTAGPRHLDTLDVCNNLACTYANLERYTLLISFYYSLVLVFHFHFHNRLLTIQSRPAMCDVLMCRLKERMQLITLVEIKVLGYLDSDVFNIFVVIWRFCVA